MTREELGAKVRRLQQAVAEIHGDVHLDGVTIRTDANGRLTELSVGHDAWSRGPVEMADLIMHAYRQAAEDAQKRSTAIMAELRDDPIVARIADATIGSGPAPDFHADRRSDPTTSERRYEELPQPDPNVQDQTVQPSYSSGRRMSDERDGDADGYFQRKSWLE